MRRPLQVDDPCRQSPGGANRPEVSRGDTIGVADYAPSQLEKAELQRAISVALPCGNNHNCSLRRDGRHPDGAPWQLRRVEEYIESHWDQPIAIEALAIVANGSARSIFHSFRQ